MKITSRIRADYNFLLSTPLDGIGVSVGNETPFDPNGFPALHCWAALDAHGRQEPCAEPLLLDKVRRSKASWNLQIKQWAADLADGLLLKRSELESYCAGLPAWILNATVKQAEALCRKNIGFVPTYINRGKPSTNE